MRKSISILLLICINLTSVAIAGWKVRGEPVKLIGGDGKYFMRPVWSPDAALIAFTESNYQGLWVMKADGSQPRQITDEPAAGFGFSWSSDAKAILSRVAKYEGKYRYNAVKVFEIEQSQSRLLTDYRAMMPGLPQWAEGDTKIFMYGQGKLEVFDSGLTAPEWKKTSVSKPSCFLKDGHLAVGNITTQNYQVFEPIAGEQYLNLVSSPEGTKVAFEVMGGNLYVMNIDGTGLVDLGAGHRPRWSPDSQFLVYMITKDDGHQYLESDLYIIKTDGSEKTRLTSASGKLEMNPSWSADGEHIAFDVMDEGAIYVIEVLR